MSDTALTQALETQFGSGVFRPLSGRGNSRVGIWQSTQAYFVKHYPGDSTWDRCTVEARMFRFYDANGIDVIPALLHSDESQNYSVFSFIDGTAEYPIDEGAHNQLQSFIERILRLPHTGTNIGEAKESFFHTATLREHIDGRLAFLRAIDDSQLQGYLNEQFEPALVRTRYAARADITCGEEIIVSPSDFGTHNSLRTAGGQIYFIDFEYGGLDSKYKLLADIYWHPGNTLREDQRWRLIAPFLKNAQERSIFEQVKTMMGLKWALLLLNEFIPNQMKKRLRAVQTSISGEDIKQGQLAKSQQVLDKVIHG